MLVSIMVVRQWGSNSLLIIPQLISFLTFQICVITLCPIKEGKQKKNEHKILVHQLPLLLRHKAILADCFVCLTICNTGWMGLVYFEFFLPIHFFLFLKLSFVYTILFFYWTFFFFFLYIDSLDKNIHIYK